MPHSCLLIISSLLHKEQGLQEASAVLHLLLYTHASSVMLPMADKKARDCTTSKVRLLRSRMLVLQEMLLQQERKCWHLDGQYLREHPRLGAGAPAVPAAG